MNAVPHLVIVAVGLLIVLGIPIGLYALLTRTQRRTTREIRAAARQQGWSWRRRRWTGDPTDFRIVGHTANGLEWIMTSGGTAGSDRGWTVRLALRFPAMGGKPDFALEPREPGSRDMASLASAMPKALDARIAAFSQVLADEAEFYREARELHTGVPAFDAAYRILGRPDRFRESPITPALAARMMNWPADAVQPHSMMAWRDPYGLHVQARLPGPPNWPSVSHEVSIGEELASHLTAPTPAPPPSTLADRLAARLSGSK